MPFRVTAPRYRLHGSRAQRTVARADAISRADERVAGDVSRRGSNHGTSRRRGSVTVTGDSPYMTVPEVAAHLRLNEKTVYEMVKRGRLDYVRAGVVKGIRITRASVDRLLTQADDPTAAAG